mgnify:FL=1
MPRDDPKTTKTNSPIPTIVGMGEFCSPSPGGRTCKETGHTSACKSREQLCRNLVTWLRDEAATKQRISIVENWGELTMMDMMVGFSKWFGQRQMDMWQASDAESHMAIARGIMDLGSFIKAFEVAEAIVLQERVRKSLHAEGLF